jgi:hypothetical protein
MKAVIWGALLAGASAQPGCLAAGTLPYPVSATAAIDRFDLVLPPGVEVRSASYSITGLSSVSGLNGNTNSAIETRPLLTVYAVQRKTGEQLVLIYDDLKQRKEPSQIIRLVVPSDSSRK